MSQPSPIGGLAPPVVYPTTNNLASIARADFNNDGVADLAVVEQQDANGNGNVEIFLGNSDGTFQAPYTISFPANQNLDWIVSADFNHDGKADLAVAGRAPGKVFILIGNGSGGFGDPVNYGATTAPNQTAIAVGDFNGDGYADLAVSGDDGDVALFTNNGDGTFSVTGRPAGGNPYSVAAADFNGDGITDLAFANFSNDNVSVLFGNGDGSFGSPATYSVPAGSGPLYIAAADLNGDGIPDLAVTNEAGTGTGVSVLLGNANGTFGAATVYFPGIAKPSALAFGDFNGDGKTDIAVTSFTASTNSVSILLGNGLGAFPTETNYVGGAWPLGLVVGDFNGDGRPDIVTADAISASNISVMLALVPTVTTLTPSPNPSTFGASVALTAAVSPSSATGTVTFFDGATSLGTGSLSGGTATLNIATLSVGAHSLTASYGGDTNDAISVSTAVNQTVNQAATITTLTTSPRPSTFGASVTLTATLAPVSATGTVTFFDGAANLGTGNLSGGTATLNISTLSVGVHSLTASYGGDANDATSISSAVSQTVNQAPTATTLTSSLNPSTFGASVTLTATLAPSNATGTVTFKDGATTLGTGTLSGGTATLNIATLSVAAHSLTASYGGDTNDATSTSATLTQTVNQAPTTTTLTSSLNPSTFGASVTLTATLAPSSATGTVTFKDGATTLGTGSLSGGTATLNISTLSVAAHSLTASYGGDTNDATSTSSTLTQTVNQAPTTTTLTSSLNPSTFGASVTLTATLAPSSATGTVTFKDGATTLGTGSLSGGTATLNISTLSVAAHSLTASYGGDTNDATSTSATLTQTVNQAPTTTTLTSSLNPSTFGASVTLTATLAPSNATGTVTFKDGATTLGMGSLSGGTATLNVSTLSVAAHSLTASYGGDTNDATSASSTLTQTVNQAPTTTTLTSSLNPSTFGASVTLTATLAPSNGDRHSDFQRRRDNSGYRFSERWHGHAEHIDALRRGPLVDSFLWRRY